MYESRKMKVKIDKFVGAIVLVIIIAYLFPSWGTALTGEVLSKISSAGIAFIFFFYGLKLSPQKLRIGLKNWKLHLLVQASTFLLFPLIVLLFLPLAHNTQDKMLWLSMLFLAALPSTVSSSVVLVSVAGGNVPAAIFNASISGLIGIMITPLWMGLFMESTGIDFDYAAIYGSLLLGIILPVIVGLLLQRLLGSFAQKYARQLSLFDKGIILLIIFRSFAQSFTDRVFSNSSWLNLLLLFVIVTVLFAAVFFITGYIASRLHFSLEDRITAQFCGTKKSLVHGSVFYKVMFGASAASGFLLLPLMIFHALQILIISFIASRHAERKINLQHSSEAN